MHDSNVLVWFTALDNSAKISSVLVVPSLINIPNFTVDTHTKPQWDFVWVFFRICIDLQLTDKLPTVDLGAVGQYITNV